MPGTAKAVSSSSQWPQGGDRHTLTRSQGPKTEAPGLRGCSAALGLSRCLSCDFGGGGAQGAGGSALGTRKGLPHGEHRARGKALVWKTGLPVRRPLRSHGAPAALSRSLYAAGSGAGSRLAAPPSRRPVRGDRTSAGTGSGASLGR